MLQSHGEDDVAVHRQPRWLLRAALPGVIGLSLILRLWQLHWLPAELYGDIIIIYDYTNAILTGQWPVYFVLSAGPLYQYLIAPFIAMTGLSFYTLKLASVLVSLGVIYATYLLARELWQDEPPALLAAFVAGCSSWLLIFSRLGNSQIITPLLTALAFWLALRALRRVSRLDASGSGLVAALGFYVYPQTFILPGVIGMVLLLLGWRTPGFWRRIVLPFALTAIGVALPFAIIVALDAESFFSGYIAEKLPEGGGAFGLLLGNLARGLLAFHVRGDQVFRSNPAEMPHLDVLSGILLLVGLVYWLLPARRRLGFVLLLVLLLLHLPALLVRHPQQVPSASRTLSIVPLLAICVAGGIWGPVLLLRQRFGKLLAAGVLVGLLVAVLLLNSQRYFVHYAAGLPDHNTPFGRLIAQYIDDLPTDTTVYVAGCCWGKAAQPHPKAIIYEARGAHTIAFVEPGDLHCGLVAEWQQPAVLIWNPYDRMLQNRLRGCVNRVERELFVSPHGDPIFQVTKIIPPAEATSSDP
jgi:4-amino-4-deoxy-L-arabinose transferase-like glycosyltransferase